jgi:hypothetical protein
MGGGVWAVLHLAVGVAIGIDVADSLELEHAFEGGGQSPSRLQQMCGMPAIYYGVIWAAEKATKAQRK